MSVYRGLSGEARFLLLRSVTPVLAAAVASVVIGYAILSAAETLLDVKPGVLFRDPVAEFGIPVFAGLFCYLGVGLLCATAAITLFVGMLVQPSRQLFLLVGGFTTLLALDDLFLMHERIVPYFGVPEFAFIAMHAVLALATVLLLVRHVGLYESAGIAFALGPLALSVLTDVFVDGDVFTLPVVDITIRRIVIEDLSKFVGWAAWFAFWTTLSFRTVQPLLHQSGRGSADASGRVTSP